MRANEFEENESEKAAKRSKSAALAVHGATDQGKDNPLVFPYGFLRQVASPYAFT